MDGIPDLIHQLVDPTLVWRGETVDGPWDQWAAQKNFEHLAHMSPDDRMDALTRLVQNGVGRPLRCAPEHWESGRTYLVLNAVACELQVIEIKNKTEASRALEAEYTAESITQEMRISAHQAVALADRYGGQNLAHCTHVSWSFHKRDRNVVALQEVLRSRSEAVKEFVRLVQSSCLVVSRHLGPTCTAELVNLILIQYVPPTGEMGLHGDSDRPGNLRFCVRGQKNGGVSSMRFAFAGYDKDEFKDVDIGSGFGYFGPDSILKQAHSTLMHGVTLVSERLYTLVLDFTVTVVEH